MKPNQADPPTNNNKTKNSLDSRHLACVPRRYKLSRSCKSDQLMGWNILQNLDMLCAKVLKGIYFPYTSFLEARQGSKASWVWNSILKGKELLKQGCRWHVRSGRDIQIWEDPWISSLPNFWPTSSQPTNMDVFLVKDLIDNITGT